MIRLWWVRHGPTQAEGMIGWTDRPADLSEASRLARLSAHLPRAPVLSSDLARARATAAALRRGRPLLPPDPRLREIHFGDWEDKRFDQIDRAALTAFFDDAGARRAPGGESWNDLCARVDAAIAALRARRRFGDVIVVAHMGPILAQVQRALRLTPRAAFAHRIEPLSVTRMVWNGRWHCEGVNHRP